MKIKSLSVALGGVTVATFFAFALASHADDSIVPSAKQKKAEARMMGSCKKEFTGIVTGKTLDQVDQWAEAQENAPSAVSSKFKKSQCYATHEVWEKLAQRNEWAATNPSKDRTRMPATTPTTGN